jgi:hypothetical protein
MWLPLPSRAMRRTSSGRVATLTPCRWTWATSNRVLRQTCGISTYSRPPAGFRYASRSYSGPAWKKPLELFRRHAPFGWRAEYDQAQKRWTLRTGDRPANVSARLYVDQLPAGAPTNADGYAAKLAEKDFQDPDVRYAAIADKGMGRCAGCSPRGSQAQLNGTALWPPRAQERIWVAKISGSHGSESGSSPINDAPLQRAKLKVRRSANSSGNGTLVESSSLVASSNSNFCPMTT